NGLLWSPEIVPSTTRRARSMSPAIAARTSGSEYLGDLAIELIDSGAGRNVAEQRLDDGIGVLSFGLGRVRRHQAVPQHRLRHGADVVYGHRGAALERGAGLGGDDQRLPGPGTGPP